MWDGALITSLAVQRTLQRQWRPQLQLRLGAWCLQHPLLDLMVLEKIPSESIGNAWDEGQFCENASHTSPCVSVTRWKYECATTAMHQQDITNLRQSEGTGSFGPPSQQWAHCPVLTCLRICGSDIGGRRELRPWGKDLKPFMTVLLADAAPCDPEWQSSCIRDTFLSRLS